MEKVLRKKFLVVSCGVVFAVLFTICSVFNIVNYMQIADRTDEIIYIMVENDGHFPKTMEKPPAHITAETPFATRYFTVKLDEEGNLISTDTRSIQLVDTKQAAVYAQEAIESSGTSGLLGVYNYKVVDTSYGKLCIFIDCNQEIDMFYSLLESSIYICLTALFSVFLLMWFLSKKAVAPIVESYQKQQQFITNITHELKTPLAIIKTNTEVMEIEQESSQWSNSIHNQISRLNQLINYLVSLSKMEEEGQDILKVDFSISDAVVEVVSSFEVLGESTDRRITTVLSPYLTYCGDEQAIRLLTSILMDNALKYSTIGTEIQVSLEKQREKLILVVSNEGENLEIGKYDQLFQRFYRIEHSRNSRLGGFGIGLAIAKTIVENHGGKIKAESADGKRLVFTVIL